MDDNDLKMCSPTRLAFIALTLFFFFSKPSHHLENICCDVNNFSQLERDTYLLNEDFLIINTTSLLKCVQQCQFRNRCASFNFNLASSTCILNENSKNDTENSNLVNLQLSVFSDIIDWPETVSGACANHNCSNTSVCTVLSDGGYACVVAYCSEPPDVTSGTLMDSKYYWDINENVQYQCDLGFEPAGERICQQDGTWSDFQCLRIAACKDLKTCNSDYSDGEYWLRPIATNKELLRVYCFEMHKANPTQYITVTGETYSFYLDSDAAACNSYWSHSGITVFQKVKLNIWNFGILHGGYAFATTNGTFGPVGRAGDCRLSTACSATQVGSFRVDLTGTGVKIESSTTWTSDTTIAKYNNGSIIFGECHGNCVLCKGDAPGFENGQFNLEYDASIQPNLSTATYPVCKL